MTRLKVVVFGLYCLTIPFGLISNSQELEIWPIRIVKHYSGENQLVPSNWFSTIIVKRDLLPKIILFHHQVH